MTFKELNNTYSRKNQDLKLSKDPKILMKKKNHKTKMMKSQQQMTSLMMIKLIALHKMMSLKPISLLEISQCLISQKKRTTVCPLNPKVSIIIIHFAIAPSHL